MSIVNEKDLKELNELFLNSGIQLTEKELLEEATSLLNLTKLLLSIDGEDYGDK